VGGNTTVLPLHDSGNTASHCNDSILILSSHRSKRNGELELQAIPFLAANNTSRRDFLFQRYGVCAGYLPHYGGPAPSLGQDPHLPGVPDLPPDRTKRGGHSRKCCLVAMQNPALCVAGRP